MRLTFEGQASAALERLRQHFEEVKIVSPNVVVVTTEEHQVPRAIFEVGEAGVQILDIDIRKPTLEDVFLQIARGGSNGHLS